MLKERISSLRNWFKYELEWQKETDWFHEFFVGIECPNGVLTKPGEEIHPLQRGLITAVGSFGLMKKVVEGKTLSEEQRRRVREAAWLTSLSGNYTLEALPEREGVRVGITLENNEALKYLSSSANTGSIVVFLSYHDGRRYRYKESSSIKAVLDESSPGIIFDFFEPHEAPTRDVRLFIYTQPLDVKNINPKFSRIRLLLGIPKSPSEL